MALDYETVGAFYKTLDDNLRAFVTAHGTVVTLNVSAHFPELVCEPPLPVCCEPPLFC